jgi:phytoene dehydrogenase-like protein
MTSVELDAVVVGAGPNGLSAAITIAQAGRCVAVYEAQASVGGAVRSAALTRPGFVHDACAAVYPMGIGSPFFAALPLEQFGLEWIHPEAPLAHPFDDGRAVLLERSVEQTAAGLGDDGRGYRRLVHSLVDDWPKLTQAILGPLGIPRHPMVLARFGLKGLRSATRLARACFEGASARGLFAGLAAHSVLPLERAASAAVGLVIAVAGHAVGWPIARGGAQSLSDALAAYLRSLGGRIVTGQLVRSLDELPASRAVLLDVTPRQLLEIAGSSLPPAYAGRLRRYRYGPGAFKIDWALDGPIPWRNAACGRAATVHVGGTLEAIAAAARAPWAGRHAEEPFVLFVQPSLFDPSRAPAGKHTGWAYCHVPHGSEVDMTDAIERQVERFAPGFRDLILARSTRTAVELERDNPNCVGGDITGGVTDLRQTLFRPVLQRAPYATPDPRIYLCSSSTPPGGGVHGMCGYHAARAALRRAL